MAWITALVSAITTAFNEFMNGVGSGIVDFFQSIFLDTSGTTPTLTTFATVSLVMLGVSLAIGVTTLVVHWVRRK